jgi:hypothetical protein
MRLISRWLNDMTPASYRVRRGISACGVHLWIAEYITHNLEVRYLAHAAVPDPICKLVAKLSGRDTLLTRNY